uniref:Uncharacterized protein n=1 Tax=Zea mays TaxID=4577 RepID=A0A804UMF9_MAIZE
MRRGLGRRRALRDDDHPPLAPRGQAVQDGGDVLVARLVERQLVAFGGFLRWACGGSRAARIRVFAGSGGRGRGACCGGAAAHGLLHVGLHLGAGEASLAHHAADAGVVEDGHHELLQLDLDGEHRLLLALHGPAPLVRLRALERRHERVGQGRRVVVVVVVVAVPAEQRRRGDRGRRGEAVQRHVEAQLQRLALQRVGVRAEARRAQQPRGRR